MPDPVLELRESDPAAHARTAPPRDVFERIVATPLQAPRPPRRRGPRIVLGVGGPRRGRGGRVRRAARRRQRARADPGEPRRARVRRDRAAAGVHHLHRDDHRPDREPAHRELRQAAPVAVRRPDAQLHGDPSAARRVALRARPERRHDPHADAQRQGRHGGPGHQARPTRAGTRRSSNPASRPGSRPWWSGSAKRSAAREDLGETTFNGKRAHAYRVKRPSQRDAARRHHLLRRSRDGGAARQQDDDHRLRAEGRKTARSWRASRRTRSRSRRPSTATTTSSRRPRT